MDRNLQQQTSAQINEGANSESRTILAEDAIKKEELLPQSSTKSKNSNSLKGKLNALLSYGQHQGK